ncbi:disease resistance protein RPM1-like [Mercurialis annua]|uniref:disease resistance protein RPM1-like n=1 Tax=Mercurialis annua TaxID=3986 RepID=UPI002160DB19|nr:disease resistance protein RPM1-like [Mercurialis annua]
MAQLRVNTKTSENGWSGGGGRRLWLQFQLAEVKKFDRELHLIDETVTNLVLIFKKFKKTLDLEGAPLDHLPAEVGNLWHLRYLSLRKTKVKKLAKSIGRLCNLETLDLRQTPVYDLPVEINRLLKLRHLLAFFININDEPDPNFQRGVKMNGSIGSLKSIQKLSYIEVDQDTGLIQQVEKLTQLRKLGIKKLKRESGVELCSALEKMPHLCTLRISSLNKEEFLDLQALSYPPPLLQRLSLSGPLVELPHWITKLRSLVRIQLNWSRLLDDALQILQDFPNLQELGFYEGYNGDELHFKNGYFGKLKVLYLRGLIGLNKLTIDEGALPLLEKLSIGPFPKFNKIPSGIHFLRNLKRLKLFDIQTQIVLGILPDNGHDYWKVEHIAIVNLYYKIKGERYRSYKLGDSDLFKRLESIEE